MSNQQIDSGASMPDEQVEVQSATHPDTPATEQQAPVDQAIHLITHGPTSPCDDPVADPLSEPGKTYTLMLEQYSDENVKKGEELAHQLVLWGHYPESAHARLFLAQGSQDAWMHARKAVTEAASGSAKLRGKDDEALKLLNLSLRVLAQARAENNLSVIEEADEEANQEGKGENGEEGKGEDDPKAKKHGIGKIPMKIPFAEWKAEWKAKYGKP